MKGYLPTTRVENLFDKRKLRNSVPNDDTLRFDSINGTLYYTLPPPFFSVDGVLSSILFFTGFLNTFTPILSGNV